MLPVGAALTATALHVASASARAGFAGYNVNRASRGGGMTTQPGDRGPADVPVIRPAAVFAEALAHLSTPMNGTGALAPKKLGSFPSHVETARHRRMSGLSDLAICVLASAWACALSTID